MVISLVESILLFLCKRDCSRQRARAQSDHPWHLRIFLRIIFFQQCKIEGNLPSKIFPAETERRKVNHPLASSRESYFFENSKLKSNPACNILRAETPKPQSRSLGIFTFLCKVFDVLIQHYIYRLSLPAFPFPK
jgi:hypothetical protein